jgi:hypothetical protein
VRYAGGGDKQVTGGILSGGTVEADLIMGTPTSSIVALQ